MPDHYPYARPATGPQAHVSSAIDRLERAGLVTRRRSDDDQRSRIVALTRAGRELIDRAFTDHMRNERHLLDLLAPAEAEALEPLLTTWLSRMEQPHFPSRE